MDEDIRTLLARIWNLLGQAGLNDALECITYLAALLTETSFPFVAELRPQRPIIVRPLRETDLQETLGQIRRLLAQHSETQDNSQLLDRYILFYASTFQKDAYPIPRHIVDFMLTILDIQPEHRFADFTCGAGGFLVNSNRSAGRWPEKIVGIEISPDWARIAAANATLHNLNPSQIDLIIDDAFHACGPEGKLRDELFHRIAIAPSFGRSIDKSLAQETLRTSSNVRASEVLFTYLAQKKLEPGGRAMVMVPISLLTNTTGFGLRQKLVNERLLEAVITLKAGMLQPFNNERVALLLIQQPEINQPSLEQCWFLNLEYDGYPLNPGRDLLAPPPLSENDFPAAKMALLPQRDFQPIPIDDDEQKGISLKTILQEQRDETSSVVIIQVPNDTTLAELRHFTVQKDSQLEYYLFIQELQDNEDTLPYALPLQLSDRTLKRIVKTALWRRELYGLSEEDILDADLPSGDHLFGQATARQKFAITREGRLLGFSMPLTNISVDTYSLVASSYLPQKRDTAIIAPVERSEKTITIVEAADEVDGLLHNLRLDLQKVEQQIMELRALLELPGVTQEPLPSLRDAPEQHLIASYLGTDQQIHWQELRKYAEVSLSGQEGMYARPFTPEELKCLELSRAEVHQVLQLLESLGLLIQVSSGSTEPLQPSTDEGNERSRIVYRRITDNDIVLQKDLPWK